MKQIDMTEIDRRAFRGVAWMGRAALFCLGFLAMLALLVVATVLSAGMLMSTALPATAVWQKRDLRSRRDGGNASEFSVPRKVAAS